MQNPDIYTETYERECSEKKNEINREVNRMLNAVKSDIKQLPMYATRFKDCVAIHINKNDVLSIIEKYIREVN